MTIPRIDYSRGKAAYKKTAPLISQRRGFTLQTLVVVVIVMMASVVVVIHIVVQIFLGRVLARAVTLDIRLLARRRAKIPMLEVFALFALVLMYVALVLMDRMRVVVHVLIVLRVRDRENQQRTECACHQCEY
jgi:hypothetical protein